MQKIALICGGPSAERGISLNSARSLLDHLSSFVSDILPIYVDQSLKFYRLSCSQLYSNTPADFDFKLAETADYLDLPALLQCLRSVDLVFPVIHGIFGEDGQLQKFLEQHEIPFVGSGSNTCSLVYPKDLLLTKLKLEGFDTNPFLVVDPHRFDEQSIHEFWNSYHLHKAVIKPTKGGSSLGVHVLDSPSRVKAHLHKINQVTLLEPFCVGKEFTLVVLQNQEGKPVALCPTEIETKKSDEIFDYRKKYLPTNEVIYHTPPRFDSSITEKLRTQAEHIFALMGSQDFLRIDGWILEGDRILFTDINPISGLEQNSFLFQQAAYIGMTHQQVLAYILKSACRRHALSWEEIKSKSLKQKLPVFVLFGNSNAERQVSLMSGANVWLKLLYSESYEPFPFFYASDGRAWKIPYSLILHHTVEEIESLCLQSLRTEQHQQMIDLIQKALGVSLNEYEGSISFSFSEFLNLARRSCAFVFLALHGAEGEDGTIQYILEENGIPFNGSGSVASALCMDKMETANKINLLNDPSLISLPKVILNRLQIQSYDTGDYIKLWDQLVTEWNCNQILVKPRYDGCSTGVMKLNSAEELETYCHHIKSGLPVPLHTFSGQTQIIEMPLSNGVDYMLEPYIQVDCISIMESKLIHTCDTGWVELTVGVIEQKGRYQSFLPSLTLAEGAVLSVEEKFQGGTGINLTPPPESIFTIAAIKGIQSGVEKAAKALGIQNYARIDLFFHLHNQIIIIIEANSLPALTPSTVIFHQALAENPPMKPRDFIETIIKNKMMSIHSNSCLAGVDVL